MSRSGSRLSLRGRRYRLSIFLLLGVLVVLLAGGGFAALESNIVSTYWEGVWWALSLMTTVGFVGESPETTGGRILSAALMVSGFALLTLTTAAIASLFVREEEKPLEETERAFETVVLARLDELATRLDAIERASAPRAVDRTAAGRTVSQQRVVDQGAGKAPGRSAGTATHLGSVDPGRTMDAHPRPIAGAPRDARAGSRPLLTPAWRAYPAADGAHPGPCRTGSARRDASRIDGQ